MPNLFKFCFDIFDIGLKRDNASIKEPFICEHDLFQLIQLVQTEHEKNQTEEQKRLKDLPYDYATKHIPVIGNSIFIDAFAYDLTFLFK